jgi:hypothetical protein
MDPSPISFILLLLFTFTRTVYFLAYYYCFPLDTLNPLFIAKWWDWEPHHKLGAKFLVVLCAGSMLLLVQSKALDEAPYKLSGAVAKLAGITFWSLTFSYWFNKPRFLTEGRLATVLIIPSSWGSQLGGYLPASSIFSGTVAREKRRFLQGKSRTHNLYFVICFALLYFCLHRFIENTKKIVSL